MLNVLKAYSVYDREVGYCQGSPFISGLLLMQVRRRDVDTPSLLRVVNTPSNAEGRGGAKISP